MRSHYGNLFTNLRHKLKDAVMGAECIETVYGLGYRLRGESK